MGKDGGRLSVEGWQRYMAKVDSYDSILENVLTSAEKAEMTPQQRLKLELGVEEMGLNIISYAYEDSGFVWVRASVQNDMFRLEFVDHGKPFDPLAKDMRHNDGMPTADQEEGGYGIFLVKKNFSTVVYCYEEMFGKMANHLLLELPLANG